MNESPYRQRAGSELEAVILSWDEAEARFPTSSIEWDVQDRHLATPVLVVEREILRAYGNECAHHPYCSCWWWSASMRRWMPRGADLSVNVAGGTMRIKPEPSLKPDEVIVVDVKGDSVEYVPGMTLRVSR